HGFGYRLTSCPENSTPSGEAAAVSVTLSSAPRRPALSLLAIGLTIVIGATSFWFFGNAAPAPQTEGPVQFAILPFEEAGGGPGLKGLGDDLLDTSSAELTDARVLIASGADNGIRLPWASSRASNTQFLLGGRIGSDGKQLNIHVQLSDAVE